MSTSSEHRGLKMKAAEQKSLKPPHRRLVLMFDGTGNKRLNLSNVARMFEAIDDSKPEDYEPYTKVGPTVPREEELMDPEEEPVQLVKYIKGVGTDAFLHLSGLGFGYGLSANVKAGYVWLSNNYREGDEIFVFGFSRGAFSARSLVSLVHRCGGVLSQRNSKKLREDSPIVVKAYNMYQAYVQTTTADGTDKKDPALNDASNKARNDFTTTVTKDDSYRIQRVTVKMLGVWDTVGSVGLPETGYTLIDDYVPPFSRFSSKWYQFHGQGLSCIVENAFHALAIDEHRKHFAPTLWDSVTSEDQKVKQVWFVGSHCNVGGGADLDDLNDPDDLWQYSYVWMQNHAKKLGLRFYWTYDSPPTQRRSSEGRTLPIRRVSLREPEKSYDNFLGGVYKRIINPIDRAAIETNGAKLHWSVTDRIALSSVKHDASLAYRPHSLFGVQGSQTAKVSPNEVEIHKHDGKDQSIVKWQIETDDPYETTEPLHRLPVFECSCQHEAVVPPKKSGLVGSNQKRL